MDAFREYWSDLHGIYAHKDLLATQQYSKTEIQSDLDKLSSLAADWQETIDKTNHREKVLNEVAAETRNEIKSYDRDPIFHEYGFFRRCNNYKFGLKRLQLRSKYIYLFTREFFDRLGSESVELRLGSKILEFTTYSMIHILNRHYHFSQKQAEKDKSLHSEIVQPRDIHVVLGHVFSLLSDEDLKRLDDDRIHFDYKGELFTVWINSATKQVKGKGNVSYERVASFYPVKNISEKQNIHTNYNKEKRDADVQVYFKP